MVKKIFIWLSLLMTVHSGFTQPGFSFLTDLSVQHNFKKGQQYTVIGQTIQTNFNFTPKEAAYVWFAYYSNGKFEDKLTATARSLSTQPQQIAYTNQAKMRLKQISIGYKRYLIGNSDAETGINVYASAGFGLVLGRMQNAHSVSIDTSLYKVPVYAGEANFKRLTIDPGLGVERYLGADFYVYGEIRCWVPTTDYPSKFISQNENAPWTGMASIGMRIRF